MSTTFWREKVVLITGGSAGFGKVLAQSFARAGAKVVIAGRDAARLHQTIEELRQASGDVTGVVADVTQDHSVAELFADVQQRFQRLDVLVNNVGRSTRGLVGETTPQQFQEMWETNFLSAVRCTQAALPLLLQSRGHLVFMGSLASKVASRYLGAYPATKFAVAAYAQQLRLELASQGLHVLLVCPGPIAREDAGHRYAEQAGKVPDAAGLPGGGVKLAGIAPETLAARVLAACQNRKLEVVLPRKARLLFAISQLFPSLGDWLIRRNT